MQGKLEVLAGHPKSRERVSAAGDVIALQTAQ